MRTTQAILGTVVLLALVAPGATPADRSSSCGSIRVVSPEASSSSTAKRRSRTRTPAFSASRILDLELQVFLSLRLKGAHNVELKVYTPKGHLYQSLPAVFPQPTSPDEETRGRRRRQEPSASAVLPVAGTTIVTSSLYGTWRAEAHVDGSTSPCSGAQEFVIEP